MAQASKLLKRYAIDAAGYFLVLLALAIGWLPGPGGIPLLILGLYLLSRNNVWAYHLRQWIMREGSRGIKRFILRRKD